MSAAASTSLSGDPAPDVDAAYARAMEFLLGRLNYERVPHDSYTVEDFKLARIQELLRLLGDPQQRLPAIHIAGTKGKGSTAAMIAAMLQAAGLRTALFTSPHLFEYEERMTVNGRRPSKADIVSLVDAVRPAVETLDRESALPGTTYFELTTALAWLYFSRESADIVVLEVGLGGRLDSTNVCRPLCTVITSISRDHMRLLGESLVEIAAEKAGIFKSGVPAVSGAEQPEVREVIEAAAQKTGSRLYSLGNEITWEERPAVESVSEDFDLPYSIVNVATPWGSHQDLRCPLPGRHQARNLALATTVFDLLSATWKPLDQSAIEAGLARVNWPLRIQQVSSSPCVILDAAHNDASIRVLCETIAAKSSGRKILVFGTSRDKDAEAMLSIASAHFDLIILTRYTRNPRAFPLDQLEQLARSIVAGPILSAPNPEAAWNLAHSEAGTSDLICVTGSLFLAAEMSELLRDRVK